MIDPAAVITAAKGAGALASAAKSVLDLVQRSKSKDPELLAQILDLYRAAIESEEERHLMRRQIAELEAKLRTVGQLVYRPEESAYFDAEKGEGPFCSACFDSKRQAIRMHTDRGQYNCPVCSVIVVTEAERRRTDAMIREHSARMDREHGDGY